MKAVVVEFDPNVSVFSKTSLYTKDSLDAAQVPGNRPLIPAWHLVDGCVKMTYWHAIKYYCNVLVGAHMRDRSCTFGEAKEFVEQYLDFRNVRIEESLIYLLGAYPPFIEGEVDFPPRKRLFQLVRNRTSECPQPPAEEEVKTDDVVLRRENLGRIMTGDPELFFEHMRRVLIESHQRIIRLHTQIHECRSAKILYDREKALMVRQPRHVDLFNWMIANDPLAQ